MTFALPELRCESTAPACTPAIGCELDLDHGGLHRNGPVVWHDPIQILIGGVEADPTIDTHHWVNGEVLLTGEEPTL